MHILDIVQNSIRAEASYIKILVDEDIVNNRLTFSVSDDGCGMSEEMLRTVRDPFTTSRTTRKVGLGIPMLLQTCRMCNGDLTLDSELGKGTTITATMDYDNIDRPPMGDMANSLYILIVANPSMDFYYRHKINEHEFELDTKEIREVLGDVPLNAPDVCQWLKETIYEGMKL